MGSSCRWDQVSQEVPRGIAGCKTRLPGHLRTTDYKPLSVITRRRWYYRYYLEAIIVLQNFQQPGVTEGMTLKGMWLLLTWWARLFVNQWNNMLSLLQVEDYVNRMNHNGCVIIGIKTHKTATQQVATVLLMVFYSPVQSSHFLSCSHSSLRHTTERSGLQMSTVIVRPFSLAALVARSTRSPMVWRKPSLEDMSGCFSDVANSAPDHFI